MPPFNAMPVANRLLATLPRKDCRRFLDSCELVELEFTQILTEPGERIRHVYFPTGSFISLISRIDSRAALEVGMIGYEGMFGIAVMMGVETSPLHAVVQGAGPTLRMTVASFRRELTRSPALQVVLNRYLYVMMAQLAQTATCTRFHVVIAGQYGALNYR